VEVGLELVDPALPLLVLAAHALIVAGQLVVLDTFGLVR